MRAVAAAIALSALAAVPAGCGGSGAAADRRAAVNAYFVSVNEAEARMRNDAPVITTALRGFTLAKGSAGEIAALQRAENDFTQALTTVKALSVPGPARTLHAHLTALLARQAELTRELIQTERYLPRFAHAVSLLPAAARTLGARVAALSRVRRQTVASAVHSYSAVFAAYEASLRATLARLAGLRAPPVLRPYLEGERATLRQRIRLSGTVTASLARRDVATANAAIHSLLTPAPSFAGAGAAAARAYDARVADVARLAARVQHDRTRLVQEVG